MKTKSLIALLSIACAPLLAQTDSIHSLKGITVTSRQTTRRMAGPVNGVSIGREELFRAACCNLGESFSTNPSVDVSYSDPATGAKQIRLLGLSGIYVQMLNENIPGFRGAAAPFALGYVPGVWMKNIAVSKGCSSVKNGYESITGQINIDYLKPEEEPTLELNAFGDSKARIELNATGNIHLAKGLSTILLAHAEKTFSNMDDNGDSFLDQPKVEQVHFDNRWQYRTGNYIFHGGIDGLVEKRRGGQVRPTTGPLYAIDLKTNRAGGYMKHAFILDHDHGTNIALMASASIHELTATYGDKPLYINQKNVYSSLIFETSPSKPHNISAGISLNHDHYNIGGGETVPGAYAQYTYTLGHKLTAMAGLRIDHSNIYGTFWTPRAHVKWSPVEPLSIRLSAGKGYRTVNALAENNNLLASGRTLIIEPLHQEEAWNYGLSTSLTLPLGERKLRVNAEYYYTRFLDQAVIDFDSDPTAIRIASLRGRSYSHTMQIDATIEPIERMSITAAYRLNDVRCTYGGTLRSKPLTSRYKALLTAGYKTRMELWQFDATLQLNGPGRLPDSFGSYPAFCQLSAQITRDLPHCSVYIGGENLTDYKQANPIIGADNPWAATFDPTMIWGPTHGAMVYAGVRVKI